MDFVWDLVWDQTLVKLELYSYEFLFFQVKSLKISSSKHRDPSLGLDMLKAKSIVWICNRPKANTFISK